MLKIKDEINLKELEKFGFKRVEFRKMFNDYVRSYQYEVKEFIDICDYHKCMQTDTIIIHDEDSVDYKGNIQIIIEDHSKVDFGHKIVGMKEETMSKLFDLIQAGLVEKVVEDE